MEDLDQSPLVSSSSADSPPRPPPAFKYQFVKEPEDEEEEEEEDEEEEDDEDLEELEVLERKPAGGLSAAPVPASPAAPLLDFSSDFVPPAPRGPLPAAPPAASERQPAWDPSPASSAGPTPSPPAAASPSKLPEDDDEPPARPPPPPPAAGSPQAEPGPAPAAPPSTPAAPKRRGSSGSVDEALFALPAASEPVIHSSAEKKMDLKEQPGNTVAAGQEDFPSVLLETAASLPSLSPLSAASFKEHGYLGNLPAALSMKGTLQETLNATSTEFLEKAKNPFVDRDLTGFPELEYSEMGSKFSSSPTSEPAATVANPRDEVVVKNKDEEEDSVSKNILHNQQGLPMTLTKLVNEDQVTSAQKAKSNFNEKEIAGEAPLREEYADFKPFERVWEMKDIYKEGSGVLAAGGSIGSKLESEMDEKYFADNLEQANPEKDSESSNDDASFPSTPEAVKDDSGAYITCAPFNPEDIATKNTFPLLEDHTSENKTDEKKIEEKKAQIVTEKNISTKALNPFLAAVQDSQTDYVTTDNLSKVTGEVVANMPEGLTPDLVQEACESELNEAAGAKIAYETKVDLVQTSEAMQESLYPVAQLCPSFEESEATPSPVLPDIVMEAPLNSVVPSGACAGQPSSSPSEAPPSVSYESEKLKSENPPPYEEAMNVKQVSGIKGEMKEPESTNAVVQETEAPYISIACDLIKETKLSTDPSPDFSTYSEIAKVEEPVPEHSELVEDSSPDSEPVDLFSDDSIPEVPQRQEEAVILTKENLTEASYESVLEHESKENLSTLPAEGGKPYLESFQYNLTTMKDMPLPDEVSTLTKKEKISLQMEDLNTAAYANDDLLVCKEAKIRESETFSDSSPIEIIDEFPTLVSSKTDYSKFTREYTDLAVSHQSEDLKAQGGAGSLPCSAMPPELSNKEVQPKDEEQISDEFSRDRSDTGRVPLLPPDVSAVDTRTEPKQIDSTVKPKVLVKEAEKKLPSDIKKEDRSPSALFSAELSKTSVVDLLYWRDIKKTGVVFGASLFLLLSLTVFSIVSVTAYIALALLSVTISFRIYKGVIQAIQKSDEGHPFRAYLESDVAVSEELVQKYSNSALGHVNCTIKELRRLFLVDDLVDSLKFAVLMWVFTYVGALFNGLTLLILALISLFSVPVIYERHQAQIDHYLGLANKNVKDAMAKIQAKIPGLKRKAE
ncbi:reticulon-4 isoform X4 [Ochotona princeps]|uniref:reticulon-4 isoform X4 n=1 Tax=Ochotona princeps TaxID=9978 RepID=UPI0027144D4F|nr:reticulon-4 isoform X4 [Ochotona princeps]